ncbi:hypothetical protein K437DRAFT_45470 [Tilletiaria anomala UBC 951]|uniref:Uncharacterized protein n=1 Tax=Tilletiaria anomala (strain ATCC 24038 / CBS 436.72 / UBC 951) TaxID=1037660 RepID=A0A066WDJ3_TILAU|nr:uncharacterized protein K437DRAFT_45470 [Tilletiaria anomala UBC 951]KDN52002.1 hypothetical protein K437DRAFT_45470 [Tilletiaria anomala UBC 951]
MAQLRQACEEGDVDVDQVIDDRGQRRSGSPTPRSGTPRQSDVLTSLTSLATSSSSSIQTLGQEAAQGVAGEVEVGDGPSLRENTPRTRPNGSLSRTNARPPLVHQGSASNMGSKLECLLRGAACLKGLHGGELSDESKEARVQGSKTLMEMSQEDTDAHTLSYQDYDDIDTDTDSDSDSGTSDIPPDTAAVDDAQRNSPKVAAEGKLIPAGSHPNAYSVESEPHQVARRKLKMDQPPMHSFNPESTQLENLSRYAWPPFKRTTSGSSSFDPARASRAQSNVTTSSGGGGNGQPTEHDALAEFIATPSDVIDQDAQELSNYQAPQMFGEAVLPDDEAQTSPGDTAAGRRGSAMDASASASRTQGDVQLSQKEHRRKHDAHSAEWHRLTQGVTRAPSQRDFVTEEQRHSSDGSDSGKIRLFHLLGARQRPAQQHQHQAQEQGHCGEEGDVREEHHGRTLYFLQDDSQLAVHLDQKAFDELEHAQMEKEQACRSLRMQQDDIKRREEADKEASASVVAANAAADVDGGANGKSSIASIDSDGDHERAGLEDGARGQSLSLPVSMGLAASDKVGESAKSTLQAQVRTESGLLGEQAVAQANEQGQEALVHSHIAPAISLEKKLDALKAEFGEVHLRDEAIKELGEERYVCARMWLYAGLH